MIVALGSIPGCAPRFVPVTSMPPDQGVVYIFRPASPVGAAVVYTVTANGAPVVRLRSGSYYPYVTPPGQIIFSAATETSSSVAINVAPGGTYFLRGALGRARSWGGRISRSSPRRSARARSRGAG